MKCESCKHWNGDNSTYLSFCGVQGRRTEFNHSCQSYEDKVVSYPNCVRCGFSQYVKPISIELSNKVTVAKHIYYCSYCQEIFGKM